MKSLRLGVGHLWVLMSNCRNCIHNCDDHSLLDFTPAIQHMKYFIYITSHSFLTGSFNPILLALLCHEICGLRFYRQFHWDLDSLRFSFPGCLSVLSVCSAHAHAHKLAILCADTGTYHMEHNMK